MTKFEPWDDSFLDVEDYQVERSAVRAAIEAIRQCRRFGTDYIIEKDGRATSVRPEDTGPYEQDLISRLNVLNEKIAELKRSESDLVLREASQSPKKP